MSPANLELFAQQLKTASRDAVEHNWKVEDRWPIFAVTYVQNNPCEGRFKFRPEQWENFLVAVDNLRESGVTKFRIWLDQCLWLRDASQGAWAHTGLLPYVLWPVLSQGEKRQGADRTIGTETRMWPFVEEVAALWGLGMVITRERRGKDFSAGTRRWISYNHRLRLEPELCFAMLLLNILHGAVDNLRTGWTEDKEELMEMASANLVADGNFVCIGADWKNRLTQATRKDAYSTIHEALFTCVDPYLGGENLYIEQSRTVMSQSWNGISEWISGVNVGQFGQRDREMLEIGMEKYNMITDGGEFQLLRLGKCSRVLWLLVAMDGPSSNFSRGKVLWTKILCGLGSCLLGSAVENGDVRGIQRILNEQLDRKVCIHSLNETYNPIQWV